MAKYLVKYIENDGTEATYSLVSKHKLGSVHLALDMSRIEHSLGIKPKRFEYIMDVDTKETLRANKWGQV